MEKNGAGEWKNRVDGLGGNREAKSIVDATAAAVVAALLLLMLPLPSPSLRCNRYCHRCRRCTATAAATAAYAVLLLLPLPLSSLHCYC